MGGGFSFPTSFPSFSNPFKDVPIGNKIKKFGTGFSRGLIGPSREKGAYRRRSASFGPIQNTNISSELINFTGRAAGNKAIRFGRTPTSPVISNNKKLSFVERMKKKLKPNKKPNNIRNIEMSNISQPKQQAGNKKKTLKKETNPSENKKKTSKK